MNRLQKHKNLLISRAINKNLSLLKNASIILTFTLLLTVSGLTVTILSLLFLSEYLTTPIVIFFTICIIVFLLSGAFQLYLKNTIKATIKLKENPNYNEF